MKLNLKSPYPLFVLAATLCFLGVAVFILLDEQATEISPVASYQPVEADDNDQEDYGNLVNINTADADELDCLPGIGKGLAENIIEFREKNGDFQSVDEVANVKGISEKIFKRIKHYIYVKGSVKNDS